MKNEKKFVKLLLYHFNKYPQMQIEDMYKLIYQNEFAGGHFIDDEAKSLENLKNEFDIIKSSTENKFEEISDKLCRIYLSKLSECSIDISTLNKFFFITANSFKGDVINFEKKLKMFLECCEKNILPFDFQEVTKFLKIQKDKGYLPVSHSKEYKNNYAHSYRVISKEFAKYNKLFCKADELQKTKEYVYIAIDGCCGSGKTTLAKLISEVYDCNVFHMDDFFLPQKEKTKKRLEEAGGNVDYERFYNEIIKGLASKKPFHYHIYNCSKDYYSKSKTVIPKKINVIEGAYSMHPRFFDIYDLKVFLHIDKVEQSKRILIRNGINMHKRFLQEWIPMENNYFNTFRIKDKSDLIYYSS